MYKMMLLLAAVSLAGCGSTAQPTASTAASNQAVATASQPVARTAEKTTEKAEVTCRTERPLGTRFGKKSCRTVDQMAHDKHEARQALSRDGGH